jgi:hypothetical protein
LPVDQFNRQAFTGWISVPFASLGGELAAIRANKILIPARDRRRGANEKAKSSLNVAVAQSLRAVLHSRTKLRQ